MKVTLDIERAIPFLLVLHISIRTAANRQLYYPLERPLENIRLTQVLPFVKEWDEVFECLRIASSFSSKRKDFDKRLEKMKACVDAAKANSSYDWHWWVINSVAIENMLSDLKHCATESNFRKWKLKEKLS